MQKSLISKIPHFEVKAEPILPIPSFCLRLHPDLAGRCCLHLLCDLGHPFSLSGTPFSGLSKRNRPKAPGASSHSSTLVQGFKPQPGPWVVSGVGAGPAEAPVSLQLGSRERYVDVLTPDTLPRLSLCSIWVEFHKCLPKNVKKGTGNRGQLQT